MQQKPTEQDKERVIEISKQLEYHSWRYHVLDDPQISDAEYDSLFRELIVFEERFPELVLPNSPSLRVGGAVLDTLPTMRHSARMYSLDNAFTSGEWDDFIQKLVRLSPGIAPHDLAFWMEPKMDGLAMELIYEEGILVTALTRGDGEVGEVVTNNIRTIRNIPLTLHGKNLPKKIEVRGEIVIAKKDFLALNALQEKKGQRLFANPRNAAAGSVRQLDSSIAATRPLRFIAYGIGQLDWGSNHLWTTQESVIFGLRDFGFSIAPQATCCSSAEEACAWLEKLSTMRESFPFELDGGVAKINSLQLQEKVGFTSRAPRWAIAWKFAAMQAQTILESIFISVGRTGVLTPVAMLKPVSVGGVTVSRATLHNQDEIENKGLLIGDTVIIQRAGDVIPEVVAPVVEKRTGQEQVFVFPHECPVCGHQAYRAQGESAWRCINKICPAVVKESIKHFVSKAGLDVKGVGGKWIEQLIDQKIVTTPIDLFCLTKERLLVLDRMGNTLATKFIEGFAQAKESATLHRFICALGIRHVGEQTAKALAKKFRSMDTLASASLEELCQVPDIGSEVATAIIEFFEDSGNTELLSTFKKIGLWPDMGQPKNSGESRQKQFGLPLLEYISEDSSISGNVSGLHLSSSATSGSYEERDGVLFGKTILFTGTLSVARSEAQAMAENAGADVLGSVSKNLDYLVAGEKAGSKLQKAQALGITILDEASFLAMLK